MAYFRLLSKDAAIRAIETVCTHLVSEQLTGEVLEMSKSAYAEDVATRSPVAVTLPACNVLGSRTLTGFVMPLTKATVQEYIRAFDSLVDTVRFGNDMPGSPAGRLYPQHSQGRELFSKFKHSDDWYSPALLLSAMSTMFGVEVEKAEHGTMVFTLGTRRLGVSPQGVLAKGDWHTAAVPAFNNTEPVTSLPAIDTKDPCIRALDKVLRKSNPGLLPALNLLVHVMHEEIVGKHFVRQRLGLELDRRAHGPAFNPLLVKESDLTKKARSKVLKRAQEAEAALEVCPSILATCSGTVLLDLRSVVVPAIMSPGEFSRRFGNAYADHSGRKFSEATRARWLAMLTELAKAKIAHANT